jgi:hypothetical protein
MLLAYAKSKREDLVPDQLKGLSKRGKELLEGTKKISIAWSRASRRPGKSFTATQL